MTAPEKRARNLIGSLTTAQLLDQWEATTTMTDPNTSTLRGWFMDELEKRFPDQFDKWLDSDCRDEDLRKFIFAFYAKEKATLAVLALWHFTQKGKCQAECQKKG